jgi:HEAT repeat protein
MSFLLRRLSELPLTEDGRPFHLLVSGLQENHNSLPAALCEASLWQKLELSRLRASVGETSGEAGTWTRIIHGPSSLDRPEGIQDAGLAAGQKLSPILDALEKGASRGELEALWVTRALSCIQSRRSIEILEKIAFEQGTIVGVMAAYSQLGSELAVEKAIELVQAVEGTSVHPQLLAGFAGLPSRKSYQFLIDQLKGGPPAIAASVAAALEGYQAHSPLPVLDALLKIPDPWVMINVVETLGRIGGSEYQGRIEKIYGQQRHPLIRTSCLQAIAGSSGEIAFRLAHRGLRSSDPNVQAAAVETMVTTGVPSQHYKDQVLGMMSSPNAKLALNACLACMAIEPRRAVKHVTDTISERDPTKILQSIHCMAYIEAPVSFQALGRMIHMCPKGVMRQEAVKSLGRLAGRRAEAVEQLIGVLELNDPAAQELTTYFLAQVHPEAKESAAKALGGPIRESPDSLLALHCIEAMGRLGSAAQLYVPDLHRVLLRGPEQANAAAHALTVSFPRSREALGMDSSTMPLHRGYAGLRHWFEDSQGLEELEQALQQTSPFLFRNACNLARMAGASGSWTQDTRRLVGLAKALGAAALDTVEVDGLGRLDQSLAIPRKQIGLGIVPSNSPEASSMAIENFLAQKSSLAIPQQASEEALLAQSVYETTSVPKIDLGSGKVPTSSIQEQHSSSRENIPKLPPPAPPPTVVSRKQVVLRWSGLGLLCLLAVFLGRYLKAFLGR